MNIETDSVVTFLIMWGVPTFMVVRGYLKMNNDDKKSALNDFRSLRLIFTIGFIIIGAFFTHLGALIAISNIKVIGIILLILGGIFATLDMWKKSKIKSMVILVLLLVVISLDVILR